MKKRYIVANWKSNKTSEEIKEWFAKIQNVISKSDDKEIIICPSFVQLYLIAYELGENNLNFHIGAQDISPFGQGPYTGEVNGKQLKAFVEYSLVGHYERRNLLGESDELVAKKVEESLKNGITPILCVQNSETPIPQGVSIVAYEPVSAIGTGVADTAENAEKVALEIKSKNKVSVLYGGSVTPENVSSFTEKLDGVLVGGGSLDPFEFSEIIKNA